MYLGLAFSLISSAIKQIPASDPAPLFCFLLSPLPHCASFILPELGCILNENIAFVINASQEILG